ncbi:MAG TPA: hypothetical protein VKD90_17280 [Gemmataceae bacterium]|nr:hypothetical protein [Gemmataceae bacterium]
MMAHRNLGATSLLISLLILPAAAGDKTGKSGIIEGKVIYKGLPIPAGTVSFHATDGTKVTASLKADGTYRAEKVPVGKTRVTIETESARPKGKDKDAPKYVKIPQKYAGANTSGLEIVVAAGKQTTDFDLND